MAVLDVLIIHRLFITTSCIIARPPLPATARRHGWQGFEIDLLQIPLTAQITVIRDSRYVPHSEVNFQWKKIQGVSRISPQSRGWLADILWVIEKMNSEFSLEDMYCYETYLQAKHPANQHIRPKTRQQLQILRDMGFLHFKGNGTYLKT
jgi:type II restriction enzyme